MLDCGHHERRRRRTVFTEIVSSRLHVLIWSNCSPLAEAGVNVLDMRPLLSVLGDHHPVLAHLDLSGARLDILQTAES
jgi:hypothetical protein